jgi:hypothetical protein
MAGPCLETFFEASTDTKTLRRDGGRDEDLEMERPGE